MFCDTEERRQVHTPEATCGALARSTAVGNLEDMETYDNDLYDDQNNDEETLSETDPWEGVETIRMKWAADGCKSLREVVHRLHSLADYYRKQEDEGWELIDEIMDDYGHMKKKE